MYAEYWDWLHYVEPESDPNGSEDVTMRLIRLASAELDYWMRGFDGANPRHVEAAKLATCAIVEDWVTNGEPISAVSGQVQSYTAGKISVNYVQGAGSSGGGKGLPRRAYMALQAAGLLSAGVRVI